MSTVAEERVLVIPTSEFHALGYFQGFSSDIATYLPALFDSDQLSYRPRGEMEQDSSFKQLIPYVLFRYIDSAGTPTSSLLCRKSRTELDTPFRWPRLCWKGTKGRFLCWRATLRYCVPNL